MFFRCGTCFIAFMAELASVALASRDEHDESDGRVESDEGLFFFACRAASFAVSAHVRVADVPSAFLPVVGRRVWVAFSNIVLTVFYGFFTGTF